MPRYSAEFNRTASTTLAVGVLQADTAARRMKLYELIVGSEATPADNAFLWRVERVTADGTVAGTTVTPAPLDLADSAAISTALENLTTNPTISGVLLSIPLNQRATFRWVAAPGGELVSPATNNLGFAITTPTSSAVAVSATAQYEE